MRGGDERIYGHDTRGSEGSTAIPVNLSFVQTPPNLLLRVPMQSPIVYPDLQTRDLWINVVLGGKYQNHLLKPAPTRPSPLDHRSESGNEEAFGRSDIDGEVLQGGAWNLAFFREKGFDERRTVATHNGEGFERGHLVKVLPNIRRLPLWDKPIPGSNEQVLDLLQNGRRVIDETCSGSTFCVEKCRKDLHITAGS